MAEYKAEDTTSNFFRSTLSATAPANIPQIRLGAERVAHTKPNDNGELVRSSTNHPEDTIIMMFPRDTVIVETKRRPKFLELKG